MANIITPSDTLNDLCHKSVEASGIDFQFRMLQEECGECVAAINHFYRNREGSHKELCIEVADVLLSAMQARSILGDEVDAAMQYKLDRLEERLNKNGH